MVYVNLEAEEARVVQLGLALGELGLPEAVAREEALKAQLAAVTRCVQGLRPLDEQGKRLKQEQAAAGQAELVVLRACLELVRHAGKGELLPDAALLAEGLALYRPEVARAVRQLGPGGEWLAGQVRSLAHAASHAGEELRSLAQESVQAEMKLGEALHHLRELGSSAAAFVHAHAPPGSAARTHLKPKRAKGAPRKKAQQAGRTPAAPSVANEEPGVAPTPGAKPAVG